MYGTSSLAGAWSAVAPPTGGVRKCRAWSPWMLPRAGVVGHGPWMVAPLSYGCSSERAGVVGHGPWSVAPPSMAVVLTVLPLQAHHWELSHERERLKVPVFGDGDEDTGSTVANVGILASGGGGAKEVSEPPFILRDGGHRGHKTP